MSNAKEVIEERERLGLTRNQLAEKLGVHPRTVARWESGAFQCHWVWLNRIKAMEKESLEVAS